jgi:Fe2+ transport system protein FeoA
MEHSLSDEAALALCRALDNPETCPDDGKSIPPCPLDIDDCEVCEAMKEDHSQKLLTELSNLKPGEEGVVALIRGGTSACKRLQDMGLTKGTEVSVVNAAPFNGPIELSVRGTTLALGRGLAGKVLIELKNGQLERFHPHGPHH